jgi:hypothetical protein
MQFWPRWAYSWLNFSMYLVLVSFVISVGLSECIIYFLLMLYYYCTGYLVFVGLYEHSWCCCYEINTLWSLLVQGHPILQRVQPLLYLQKSYSCLYRFVYSLFALNSDKLLLFKCGNFLKSGMDIYCGHTTEVQTVHNEATRCAWKVLGQFFIVNNASVV